MYRFCDGASVLAVSRLPSIDILIWFSMPGWLADTGHIRIAEKAVPCLAVFCSRANQRPVLIIGLHARIIAGLVRPVKIYFRRFRRFPGSGCDPDIPDILKLLTAPESGEQIQLSSIQLETADD